MTAETALALLAAPQITRLDTTVAVKSLIRDAFEPGSDPVAAFLLRSLLAGLLWLHHTCAPDLTPQRLATLTTAPQLSWRGMRWVLHYGGAVVDLGVLDGPRADPLDVLTTAFLQTSWR